MANIYVKHTGSNTSPYDTWAKAATTLATALAAEVAGDTIYVSSTHTESTNAPITYPIAGTSTNPVRIISSNDSVANTSAYGGYIETTGASSVIFQGYAYINGLSLSVASGASAWSLSMGHGAQATQTFENCLIASPSTASAQGLTIGAEGTFAGSYVRWINTDLSFNRNNNQVRLRNSIFSWEGGAYTGAVALIGPIFSFGATGRGGIANISGVDFSTCASTVDFSAVASGSGSFTMSGCKLPASWTGELYAGDPPPGFRARMVNCDSGDTNYKLRIAEWAGKIRDEPIVVRTGGATDGTTPISYKMQTFGNANVLTPLISEPMGIWNEDVGVSKTVTVEIITDNVTLTNGEIFLTVEYPATLNSPLTGFVSDDVQSDNSGNILAGAVAQTSSSVAWTTTGLTTPVKQKLSVTFTPQEKGWFYATVSLARLNTTVYYCPKLEVT